MRDEFMKYSDDLIKHGLTPNDGYVLLCIADGKEAPGEVLNHFTMRNLKLKGFLDEEGNLTGMIEMIGGELKKESVANVTVIGSVERLAEYMRAVYPKMMKDGRWPTRSSQADVIDRVNRFRELFKIERYTFREILDATTKYVDSFNEDYEYMQLLKYFILKYRGVVPHSSLKDIIDAIRDGAYEEKHEAFRGDEIE